MQNGDAAAATGAHYGVDSIEGIIAPFWCDLNADGAAGAGEGIYYQIIRQDTTQRFMMIYDELIVTYNIPVFGTQSFCQFQTMLRGDGTVLMQYKDMPTGGSGSWSTESIGFEDATGAMGAQIQYGSVPPPQTAFYIPNTCHVLAGSEQSGCCNTRFCHCEGNLQCMVETDFGFAWEDIIDNTRGTMIQSADWTNNNDDGWFHLDLPFDFNWYGQAETTITIGTNGVLSFGQELLPWGDSEPVPCQVSAPLILFHQSRGMQININLCRLPCQWNGGAQGAGMSGCVGNDPNADPAGGAATGGHYGVEIDGIIAPFWADLAPHDASGSCATAGYCGVYYLVQTSPDITLAAFNKVIVEYRANVWQAAGSGVATSSSTCHFEVILFGDGTVVFQYQDMPTLSGSWSHESIGFEDRSGTQGVQISYGEVPVAGTAYQIPPACHVEAGVAPADSCCTSITCQCEAVQCSVVTDFRYDWVDISTNGRGTLITDAMWEQNNDDGWYHVDLTWDFHWFGLAERRVTVGTNGVLTFGSIQLGNGASEPVPCAWVGGGAIQGGQSVDGCAGVDYGTSGNNNVSPDGIIAPFWADLTNAGGNGVYFQLVESPDARMLAFNQLIVEWNNPVWNGSPTPCWFEVVLSGDGSVLFQYNTMPTDGSGSWSTESIGFEDQTGSKGVQISYGEVPRSQTAYYIPPSCHVAGGEDARSCTGTSTAVDASTQVLLTCDLDAATDNDPNCPEGCTEVDLDSTASCCTSQVCQCENVPSCSVDTDVEWDDLMFVDLSGTGVSMSTCPSFGVGDGVGGSEEYLGDFPTSAACVSAIQAQRPLANGATYPAAGSMVSGQPNHECYAEFGMTSKIDSAGWSTCVLSNAGTQITAWENNGDDGWFHLDLPFDFNWFGTMERRITIGTNGVLTFGDDQLPYGDSEPVPCQWSVGDAFGQGVGSAGCVQNGADPAHAAAGGGGHYGVNSIEGIIAVFWCDLNPNAATGANEGVFYEIQQSSNPAITAWNKVVIEWVVPVFGQTARCHFEAILSGDGTVQLLYLDMPTESGSWATESIGFEDQTGTLGVQISYGVVPDTSSGGVVYTIPPPCHQSGDNGGTCCTDQICQCEGLLDACTVQTDADFHWIDIIATGLGTRVGDTEWTNDAALADNGVAADDGWFHLDLPFDFNWFGIAERRITIGTNGALSFGDDQLPYGDSEPVPCQWTAGTGSGASCVQSGGDPTASTGHYGVAVEGIIAVFWCDLNPSEALVANGEGVYYQIIQSDTSATNTQLEAFNRVIISYQVPVYGSGTLCHFQAILLGDGTVIMQYLDMPADTGSWSTESIGFEDRTGTMGVQISYGSTTPAGGTAYRIDPACHVPAADLQPSCCSDRACECEGITDQCVVDTGLDVRWVDIISNQGTQITAWENNGDDGWFHIPLSFPFNWFGRVERTITAGTNGVLTFGDDQLPYGDSEPVPCQWNGGGQGAGRSGCVADPNADPTAPRQGHYGTHIDGLIAVFWTDLNPDGTSTASTGVYYQEIVPADSNRGSGRNLINQYKMIIEYNIPVFGQDAVASLCHFEIILGGDGSVLLQYLSMPLASGSWATESIGFEDQTGAAGVQIAYAEVPLDGTAYYIPSNCHVSSYNAVANEEGTCCTSKVCMCEDVTCNIETDYTFEWVDIIDSGVGTQITAWEQNADDGWFDLNLPFDFAWFGRVEQTITVGTNGILSFGTGQLPYGSSEPCPCSFGDAACDHGAEIEGVIAPFWADLNPSVADGGARGKGVWYEVITNADPRLVSWNRLIVSWDCETFWAAGYNIQTDAAHVVQFQVSSPHHNVI